jgi:cytoskeletal protein CcmA (bactofilin family)
VQRPLVPGIPSRRVDPNGVVTQQPRHLRPNQQQSSRQTVADEGELVVGQGITVKGGIRNCRRLVVHGTVQATVPARALEVGPDGVVEGRIEVAEATIAGRFDGDLIVDGPLTVAPGGLIKGRVRYRSLTVEAGGHVSAEIDHLDHAPLPAETPTTVGDGQDAVQTAEDANVAQAPVETPEPVAEDQPAPEEAVEPEPAARTDAPGVPPAFSGLKDLNGGKSEVADETAAAEDDSSAHEPADDGDQDAERFYRSLARTSARV